MGRAGSVSCVLDPFGKNYAGKDDGEVAGRPKAHPRGANVSYGYRPGFGTGKTGLSDTTAPELSLPSILDLRVNSCSSG